LWSPSRAAYRCERLGRFVFRGGVFLDRCGTDGG
jgi:hypothetical protein